MADTYNTTLDQGSTWNLTVEYEDPNGTAINLTGYSAKLQFRTSPLAVVADLTLTSITLNGGITIVPLTGTLNLTATPTQTSLLKPQRYVYDLEITSGTNQVTRLIEGTIQVSPEVTR